MVRPTFELHNPDNSSQGKIAAFFFLSPLVDLILQIRYILFWTATGCWWCRKGRWRSLMLPRIYWRTKTAFSAALCATLNKYVMNKNNFKTSSKFCSLDHPLTHPILLSPFQNMGVASNPCALKNSPVPWTSLLSQVLLPFHCWRSSVLRVILCVHNFFLGKDFHFTSSIGQNKCNHSRFKRDRSSSWWLVPPHSCLHWSLHPWTSRTNCRVSQSCIWKLRSSNAR